MFCRSREFLSIVFGWLRAAGTASDGSRSASQALLPPQRAPIVSHQSSIRFVTVSYHWLFAQGSLGLALSRSDRHPFARARESPTECGTCPPRSPRSWSPTAGGSRTREAIGVPVSVSPGAVPQPRPRRRPSPLFFSLPRRARFQHALFLRRCVCRTPRRARSPPPPPPPPRPSLSPLPQCRRRPLRFRGRATNGWRAVISSPISASDSWPPAPLLSPSLATLPDTGRLTWRSPPP